MAGAMASQLWIGRAPMAPLGTARPQTTSPCPCSHAYFTSLSPAFLPRPLFFQSQLKYRPVRCAAAESKRREAARRKASGSRVESKTPAPRVESKAPAPRVEKGEGEGGKGIFRAEQRRAEVRLPALMLQVGVAEVLEGGEAGALAVVNAAVAGGATMLLLTQKAQDNGSDGGGALYEAACSLRTLLRGRAELLIAERADIAAAAQADGVLLSEQGLPSVIARRTMQGALGEGGGGVMPLVARSVGTVEAARKASAEGADFLILAPKAGEGAEELAREARTLVSIPLLFSTAAPSLDVNGGATLAVVEAGADGLLLPLGDLSAAHAQDAKEYTGSLLQAMGVARRRRSGSAAGASESQGGVEASPAPPVPAGMQVIDEQAALLLEEERALLTRMRTFLKEATPEMAELSLLEDALAQLDELFLLVIVGEFNSGKSSVVNALLGERHLKEGVVPTTNEITLLKHSDDSHLPGEERSERHPDGHIMRFINADLLKQINLVDTPGTNVILQRQQRLTEEFVPRADLVLFVLSADRPLTESEVSFLRYIRQWGKKVIFVLNKADLFSQQAEQEEVIAFVSDNAARLLSVDAARVYPVSARRALRAKLAARSDTNGSPTVDLRRLAEQPDWASSGFDELEHFIAGFLGGGGERIRLKLDTPLGVGAALLAACARQLNEESGRAAEDLAALSAVEEQLDRFRDFMEKDSLLYRQRCTELIAEGRVRAEAVVDKVLQLSNAQALTGYLLGSGSSPTALPVGSRFSKEVVQDAFTDLKVLLREHASWLSRSSARQVVSYREFARARWPALAGEVAEAEAYSSSEEEQEVEAGGSGQPGSLALLEGFDLGAAALVLDEEIREVVAGTAARTGGAAGSAFVLTSVLPNTLEDLLALTVCSLVGYMSVLNLPARRAEVKQKVARVAENLTRQIEEALRAELDACLKATEARIGRVLEPHRMAAQAEMKRVGGLSSQLADLDNDVRNLRQSVRVLGE